MMNSTSRHSATASPGVVIIAYGDDDNGDVVDVGIYVMRVMMFIH